jgi:prepilin-type N-terminal cleavage/methylation domain-containing protein
MKKSFTLIELLVVIAIIGLLSGLVVLRFTVGRQEAYNARRVQEVNGLVKSLAIYENQYGFSVLESGGNLSHTLREVCNTNLPVGERDCTNRVDLSDLASKNILNTIPIDPSLPSTSKGTGYWIAMNNGKNQAMVTPALYKSNCPDGYISVPGNSFYNTLPGFCVMKWEAKCDLDDGSACGNPGVKIPVSTAENRPWTDITQVNSKNRCQEANAHLITNNEWMTIARNVEAIDSHWTNGEVGNGSLTKGNSDSGCIWTDYDCGALNGLTHNCGEGSNPLSNCRIFTLTNGEVVWDIAGNVWHWIDELVADRQLQPNTTSNPDSKTWGSTSFTNINYYGKYSYDLIRPSNINWNYLDRVGHYWSSNNDNRTFLRGSGWSTAATAGVFTLIFNSESDYNTKQFGFRCAK